MPNDRVSWITAWPMSRMFTPPCANTPVIAAVRPGRSSPVMLIRTISRKARPPEQWKNGGHSNRIRQHPGTGGALPLPGRWVYCAPIHSTRAARVNRPDPVKNDNFFLQLFNALRRRRVSLALRIACHSLLLVALALIIYAW